MLGSPLGFLLPSPCLGVGRTKPPQGGCCAPVAVAEHWEHCPAVLTQMFPVVGVTFSLSEVAMVRGLLAALLLAVPSSVCGSGMRKGQGQGCPWGYNLLGMSSAKGMMTNLFAVFSQEKKMPTSAGDRRCARLVVP